MKRNFFIILLILITGLGITIYLIYTHEPTDQAAATPDFRLTTSQLLAAFENDSAAARKKFTNKIVEITGLVKSLDTSGSLVLSEPGKPAELVVAIDNRYLPLLKQTAPGAEIVIQGMFSNFSSEASTADDLLAGLGATVSIREAGIKRAPLRTDN